MLCSFVYRGNELAPSILHLQIFVGLQFVIGWHCHHSEQYYIWHCFVLLHRVMPLAKWWKLAYQCFPLEKIMHQTTSKHVGNECNLQFKSFYFFYKNIKGITFHYRPTSFMFSFVNSSKIECCSSSLNGIITPRRNIVLLHSQIFIVIIQFDYISTHLVILSLQVARCIN